MPLQVTPVNRNLQTRVTFMYLEFEDLFVVLGAAAVMNVVGHFVGGEIAGMPMNLVLQYGVPLFVVPVLMAFKYGKPRLCPRPCALVREAAGLLRVVRGSRDQVSIFE